MNFTQEQISEILFGIAKSNDGMQLLMKMTLESIMKVERELYQEQNPSSQANGFRPRKAYSMGNEFALKVPRIRNGSFHPMLLGVLRNEEEESKKLVFSLYSKGLTTEQVSDVYEEVYGKTYSKQQISYLMKESKKNVHQWLDRSLESHYLVLFIDATFVHVRRDESVSKEGFYTILGIKEDGTREVLSIVNHPTESATLWKEELEQLKKRGVKSVGLVVSDGLTGIENAIPQVFKGASHQLCVVHLKRNILIKVSSKKRKEITEELEAIFDVESENTNQVEAFEKLCTFAEKWGKQYPSLKNLSNAPNSAYFTYLKYPKEIRRMIYTTNWIERLNRDYKRVLKMRTSMPNSESVIALMGSVAMEKENGTYKYPVTAFRGIKELQKEAILRD